MLVTIESLTSLPANHVAADKTLSAWLLPKAHIHNAVGL